MTVLRNVEPRGARHCETNTLGVLLRHEGLDLSEPMLFGLGSGLSFVYWDAKAMPVPFLGGRVKPFELTRNLAARLELTLLVQETTSPRRAWRNVAAAVDAGRPAGLQLDSYHLDHFRTKVHFGGHVVAMYGYDEHYVHLVDTSQHVHLVVTERQGHHVDAERQGYLVDTGQQGHLVGAGQQGGAVRVSRDSLALARAERGPMTARNRSFTLALPERPPRWQDRIVPAIKDCAAAFLSPPIANLGHRGIGTAAARVPGWLRRAADPRRDLPQAAFLMERAGTGGGLFRVLYRDFLAEAADLIPVDGLRTGHALYAEAATGWTEVAALIAEAGESGEPGPLAEAGTLLRELERIEREAMQALLDL